MAVTRQWIELDDAIAQRRRELRTLVKQQHDTTHQLTGLMQHLEIRDLGLGGSVGGVLRQKVSSTYAPITKAHVEQVVRKYLPRNELLAQQIVQGIFQDERPKVEKVVLRRCKR